jgi:hypothetical protein
MAIGGKMNDRVLLDVAQKAFDEWERNARAKAELGHPKEYDENFEEEMHTHDPEMKDMLPGLRTRRDQLRAEREIDEDNETGASTNESNAEVKELDEIISNFEMYV